jgi:hypothetical protein
LQELANHRKLITGIMILIALLILGYNAFRFADLYDSQPVGASYASRSAGEKRMRLEEIFQNKKDINWSQTLKDLDIKEIPSQAGKTEEYVPVLKSLPEQTQENEVLPMVAGIMKTMNSDGSVKFAGIINNRILYENDTISGFSIKGITEEGVYLTKGQGTWFVEAPGVSYSKDRGK